MSSRSINVIAALVIGFCAGIAFEKNSYSSKKASKKETVEAVDNNQQVQKQEKKNIQNEPSAEPPMSPAMQLPSSEVNAQSAHAESSTTENAADVVQHGSTYTSYDQKFETYFESLSKTDFKARIDSLENARRSGLVQQAIIDKATYNELVSVIQDNSENLKNESLQHISDLISLMKNAEASKINLELLNRVKIDVGANGSNNIYLIELESIIQKELQ